VPLITIVAERTTMGTRRCWMSLQPPRLVTVATPWMRRTTKTTKMRMIVDL
jgi:hypothetical protein